MKLPRSIKKQIKIEQEKCILKMSEPELPLEEWEELESKYHAYEEMVKPTWKITPDTALVVAGNLMGILLILNFEKLDIVRSKALSFVLKGRV